MPYRRTENVVRRLAEREQAILDAAGAVAAEGGMAAVQIAEVAARAGIAAGTVYRYFPSKTDLVAELVATIAGRELDAMQAAADAAPGPLSALAAAIATFAARALHARRLAWAVIAEPVDARGRRHAARFPPRARRRTGDAHQDCHRRPPAARSGRPRRRAGDRRRADGRADRTAGAVARRRCGAVREAVQAATLLVLRALGVVDARARGLVAQCVLP